MSHYSVSTGSQFWELCPSSSCEFTWAEIAGWSLGRLNGHCFIGWTSRNLTLRRAFLHCQFPHLHFLHSGSHFAESTACWQLIKPVMPSCHTWLQASAGDEPACADGQRCFRRVPHCFCSDPVCCLQDGKLLFGTFTVFSIDPMAQISCSLSREFNPHWWNKANVFAAVHDFFGGIFFWITIKCSVDISAVLPQHLFESFFFLLGRWVESHLILHKRSASRT